MPVTGNEDHSITLAVASEWTANYRDTISVGEVLGNYFGQSAIQGILDQADCVGIRIYYAINEDDEKRLIIVGVNADGNDLYEGLLAEMALQNPPYNVASNPLNS